MGRVLEGGRTSGGGADVTTALTVPIGGYSEVLRPNERFKPVNTALLRADYPELDAEFPFSGLTGEAHYIDQRLGIGCSAIVCSPNGLWMAFTSGTVYFSYDGRDWVVSAVTKSGSLSAQCAAYGNGVFVFGSSYGYVLTADENDPSRVVEQADLGGDVWDVCYGNGLFVAAVNDAANPIWTSPDGVAWTAQSSPVAAPAKSCAYNAARGLFVVGTDGVGAVQTSPDGVTWTRRTDPATNNGVYALAANNAGRLLAGGEFGRIWYSDDDGVTWTEVRGSASYPVTVLAHDPVADIFVYGVSNGSNIFGWSADGAVLNSVNTGWGTIGPKDAAVDRNGQWVVAEPSKFGLFHVSAAPYVFLEDDPAETRLVRVK